MWLRIIVLTFLFINLLQVSALAEKPATLDTQRVVKLYFPDPHQDLGEVKKGEKVSAFYEFTNVGNEAIEIELVSACECTTVDWPRKPVPPGENGRIDIVFDSATKEESETIEIDVHLKNIDPKTGYPVMEILSYSYTLIN